MIAALVEQEIKCEKVQQLKRLRSKIILQHLALKLEKKNIKLKQKKSSFKMFTNNVKRQTGFKRVIIMKIFSLKIEKLIKHSFLKATVKHSLD